MVQNYRQKMSRSSDELTVMEFHRKHLLLFLGRFRQFLSRFATPSSSLLSHDIFLVVEAVTIVARSDWRLYGTADAESDNPFSRYFTAFDELVTGLGPLDRGAAACVEALETANSL